MMADTEMQMTKEEIIRNYTEALNKQKQIKILADLNVVTPAEIRKVLAEAGVAGVKMPVRMPAQRKNTTHVEPSEEAFQMTVEKILSDLPEDMSEDAAFRAQEPLQVLFRDYVDKRLRKKVRHE